MVESIVLTIAFILLIPIALLFIECVAALFPEPHQTPNLDQSQPDIKVLIPAHNEELSLGQTLQQLIPQIASPDQVLVIADNCSDATAEIARSYRVSVIERQDSVRKGKGYALDYGLQSLSSSPPEAVIFVDADCLVEAGAMGQIAQMAIATHRPVQAVYVMQQPANPTPKDAISALAFLVKNLVRPRGLARLGVPCLLTGTGMAFPWESIQQISLASGNIVEDMQLGLDLAIAGFSPVLCSTALVKGQLPQNQEAAKGQRTRWEHGHLKTLLSQSPRLLKEGLRQGRLDLMAIALDLCIPPLALLVLLWVFVLSLATVIGIAGISWLPALLLAMEGGLLAIAVILAWARFGRDQLPFRVLLTVPLYILWKIPLYLTFLVRPQTKWVRTERDALEVNE